MFCRFREKKCSEIICFKIVYVHYFSVIIGAKLKIAKLVFWKLSGIFLMSIAEEPSLFVRPLQFLRNFGFLHYMTTLIQSMFRPISWVPVTKKGHFLFYNESAPKWFLQIPHISGLGGSCRATGANPGTWRFGDRSGLQLSALNAAFSGKNPFVDVVYYKTV